MAKVPKWVRGTAGVGIIIGLLTYGYSIMRSVGVKLVAVSPSRGFAIELGSAVVIAFGSLIGVPLSTSNCQVGAETGVGLLEGRLGVNWPLFARICLGWVGTFAFVGVLSAGLFAYGVHMPSIKENSITMQWTRWAGGFCEGVRQAHLVNNPSQTSIVV